MEITATFDEDHAYKARRIIKHKWLCRYEKRDMLVKLNREYNAPDEAFFDELDDYLAERDKQLQ